MTLKFNHTGGQGHDIVGGDTALKGVRCCLMFLIFDAIFVTFPLDFFPLRGAIPQQKIQLLSPCKVSMF